MGDDGTQYYLSRANVGNNPMMVFGGERIRFEAHLSDKTPECTSCTQPDGTPFSRAMHYGVMFRSGEDCSIYAGDKSYLSVPIDDIIQKDLIRGGSSAGTTIGAPVCFYLDKGMPQTVIRAPGPSKKRHLPTGGFESVNTISKSPKRGEKASVDDFDIANLLDSFETK